MSQGALEPALVSAALVALDLSGTFVFALSGAAAGVRHRLDFFGVLVLAFLAGNSGGIARDLLIDAAPSAIYDWRYPAVSIAAGLVTFWRSHAIGHMKNAVQLFDAAGLALFAVAGASRSLAAGAGPGAALLLGTLTGIGGGVVRDVLVREIPLVLRREVYAVAALLGAAVVVTGDALGVSPSWAAVTGAALCFALRLIAMRRDWHLPTARPPDAPQ